LKGKETRPAASSESAGLLGKVERGEKAESRFSNPKAETPKRYVGKVARATGSRNKPKEEKGGSSKRREAAPFLLRKRALRY